MKRISLFIIALILYAGCNSPLDIEPEEALTFKNFKTQKGMTSLILKAEEETLHAIHRNSIRLEIGAIPPEGNTIRQLPSNPFLDDIGKAISICNAVLKLLPNVEEVTEEWRNLQKGEMLYFKSLIYLIIAQTYGDYVLIKEEPYVGAIAKSSWVEIVDYAIECGEEAAMLLPHKREDKNWNYPPTHDNFFYGDKGMANAVLAHLYAWKAGCKWMAPPEFANYDEKECWKKCAEKCTDIIKSGFYELEKDAMSMKKCFLIQESSKENILVLPYIDLPNFGSTYVVFFRAQEWMAYPPANYISLAKKFNKAWVEDFYAGGDNRKYAFFDYKTSEQYIEPDRLLMHKFYTRGVGGSFTKYRLGGIYLLRAEAREQTGDRKGAVEDMDTIRKRANASLYDPGEYGGDLRLAIFKEREKELWYEGHRLYDLMRHGIPYIREGIKALDMHSLSDQDFLDGCLFSVIPRYLFEKNTLLRQNKYWFKHLPRH